MCNRWLYSPTLTYMSIYCLRKPGSRANSGMTWSFRLDEAAQGLWAPPWVPGLLLSFQKMYSTPGGRGLPALGVGTAVNPPKHSLHTSSTPSPAHPQAWAVHTGTASFPQRSHAEKRRLHVVGQAQSPLVREFSLSLRRTGGSMGCGETPHPWEAELETGQTRALQGMEAGAGHLLLSLRTELHSTPIISLKTDRIILKSSLPSWQSGKVQIPINIISVLATLISFLHVLYIYNYIIYNTKYIYTYIYILKRSV